MDIDGLGEERAGQFLKEGLIENVADIYDLTVEKLVELEGFGEISANNLLEAIEASKKQPFYRVLVALGIAGIGGVNARKLTAQFRTIDALLDADPEAIAETRGDRPDPGRAARGHARRGAHAQDHRAPARARAPVRGEGPGARHRGPARGQDVRDHGHAARHVARGGHRADRGGRRQGHGLGLEEDRLPRGRCRPGRLEVEQGAGDRHRGDRRAEAAEADSASRTSR